LANNFKYTRSTFYIEEYMPETELLERMAVDIGFLKNKVVEIGEYLEDLDIELHRVKPEYIKKLEEIKKEGTVSSSDFEKKFGVLF
jgi:hypothetical protein